MKTTGNHLSHRSPGRIVGREREREQLRELLGQTVDEQGGLALVSGDADEILMLLGARPALDRAQRVREQLSSRSNVMKSSGGLSEREIEVLRLVASGMTDREIAGELYISPRTVGQHLGSIYNKLGVANRTEATRFAVEHQII